LLEVDLGFDPAGTLTLRVAPSQSRPAAGQSEDDFMRAYLAERDRMTFFVEGGVGASYASVEVPERGTRFNYLLQAGGGVTHRLGRRASVMLDLRLFHLSNNSLNGPDHNPDIEALGGHAGILVWF